MKNLLTAFLPALALLALGGCAGTAALTSTEDDGVYYSSKDRTTAVVRATPAPAPTAPEEAANPDYNGNTARPSTRPGNSTDQYYDDTYTYSRSRRYHGPGLTYYTPYSPYPSLNYSVGSYWGGNAYGFYPYGAVYDPFYSPFGYGYGSGFSISFGYAQPWGYGYRGGYGRPYGYGGGFYNPYYGGGFYDPYYYGGRFYGGYYGRSGYYGNNYYGGNYGGNRNYSRSYSSSGQRPYNSPTRTSGHRSDRASDGRYPSRSGSSTAGSTPGAPTGGGRMRSERLASGPDEQPTQPTPATGVYGGSRTPSETVTATPSPQPEQTTESFNRPRRMDRAERPAYRSDEPFSRDRQPMDVSPSKGSEGTEGNVTRDETRGRWRSTDVVPQEIPGQPQPVSVPQEEGRRRGGFLQDVLAQPSDNTGQTADEPVRQRSYEQPRRQRSYEQPQQRTYEQPQQRTYEQPQQQQQTYERPQQRSESQPSYSAPSNGGERRGRSRAD